MKTAYKISFAINQIPINNCDGTANEDAIKAVRYLQEVHAQLLSSSPITDENELKEDFHKYYIANEDIISMEDACIFGAKWYHSRQQQSVRDILIDFYNYLNGVVFLTKEEGDKYIDEYLKTKQ